MDWETARKEIQFWLDFAQSDIAKMPVEEKGAVTFKINDLFGMIAKDSKGDSFRAYERQLPSLQNALLKYFDQILTLQKNPDTSYIVLPKITRFVTVFNDQLLPTPTAQESFDKHPITQATRINPGVLILRIFDLMMGRSPNIIKRCIVCQKLFCHLPKKNKYYCSTACRWRASKQRYRERKAA